ncbi:protein-glucosylgalactosylhydroxylysine glucosidase-like [Culicoides brevitarsis]|uniref:protein-glucosylgalactosylhydroxylysine glucosidase-like n=1 Tax=Culicoides brevitarsis TaxID=469753 RepID=UPI00307B3101
MNGVYNGKEGDSSRARIPNWANIRMDYCTSRQSNECEWNLNVKDGVFRETIRTKDFHLEHVIFAHRIFNRAIINQISVTRLSNNGDLTLKLSQNPGPSSIYEKFSYPDRVDIDFNVTSSEIITNRLVHRKCGNTLIVEDERYQKETRAVCVFYTDIPQTLVMKINEFSNIWTFIMTVDESTEVARAEITDLLLLPDHVIFNSHKGSWNNFWSHQFDIHLFGDPNLASAIHASIFYLASNLPSPVTRQPQTQFYGLSPNGLGRGGFNEDYWGHNFWDTEIWMFPTVNFMNSGWARQLLGYRYLVLAAAMDFANETGFRGARFPWESGFTGREVTPEPIYSNEIHITADVSFAMRQYFAMTHDKEWLIDEGCEMSREIARFFASRSVFNETTGKYDINEVIGPDEDNKLINNNVFTNVAASYALKFGVFTECLCSKLINYYPENSPETSLWNKIADNLHINYDAVNDYHPQFDGYKIGTSIKQADTILLGFPLEYQGMNASTRANDLEIYEKVTRASGPAMTWSMHAINHLDLQHKSEADRFLNKSYADYIRSPFNVWCEYTSQGCGAVNFITGAGGFLQVILSGYAGIRTRLDHLLIKNPEKLPDVQKFKIHGLTYMGNRFSVNYDPNVSFIEFSEINENRPRLVVESEGIKYLACRNCKFHIFGDDLKLYLDYSYPINQCLIA